MTAAPAEPGWADAAPVREWLREAERDPAGLPDEGYAALLGAGGRQLDELAALADGLRARAVGDVLTYVVNRNFDTAAVSGAAAPARRRLAELVTEARDLGATEICMQGPLPPDSDDDHLGLIAAIAANGPIHLHAFRPPELLDGAARAGMSLPEFLGAAKASGLGSVPGTAARILDDDVRERLNGGPDLPAASWIEVIETAHRAGLFSTSTMVYGHVETPAHVVAHLRTLAGIQDRTGGFTEFIAMPHGDGVSEPPGRLTRAVYAVARLMLHGRIDNIQVAWPKLGVDAAAPLLRGGANDLGGLLLAGHLDPHAGPEAGRSLARDDVSRIAASLGRTARQRTTGYGDV